MAAVTKTYPTFDCDAHVTELPAIWGHVAAKDKELVKNWYWVDGDNLVVNGGRRIVRGRWANRKYWAACAQEAAGPGVTKPVIKKLRDMQMRGELTPEQILQSNHDGAREPHARLRDLDLMGIDQVVVIPIAMLMEHPFVENIYAADITARAYNDWVYEWCSVNPERLFPAAAVATQAPELAAAELRRAAKRNFHIGMVHAADQQHEYPNQPKFDPLWRAFEETGLVCAMHNLPNAGAPGRSGPGRQATPGEFGYHVLDQDRSNGPDRGMGFCYEAVLWLTNVLLSGFLERYPKLTMALMECNSTWLPFVLEECDRAFRLYKNVRQRNVTRLPSDMFQERCFVSFESDEKAVFQQYRYFENVGIWASDVYHSDGADAWSAIREMQEADAPLEVQAKLMGGNARRMYRIEPKMYTTREPASYPRPAWYPTMEQIEREYASVTHVS